MQCHKPGHHASARCVSALLAAGALLAAAADSLGGTSAPATMRTAPMTAQMTAFDVSSALRARSVLGEARELAGPQAARGPVRPSPAMSDPSGPAARRIAKRMKRRHRHHGHHGTGHHSAPARHTGTYLLAHLPPATNKKAAAAIHEALSLIGVPYRWGGTTKAGGFDCSGFTQHVWATAGVKIPRTVRAQARAGSHVSLNSVQPGDLVVFYPAQHHVGIYVGNGLVIDSPHTGASVRPDPVRSMPVSVVVRVHN
jgi:cell wall-associated NlpC family hydrolase